MAADLEVETTALADGRGGVSFRGEVDATNVATFREALVGAAGARGVVADLRALTYLDSAGVEVFFDVGRGTNLEIVAPPGCPVRRLLEVVSITTVAVLRDEPPR